MRWFVKKIGLPCCISLIAIILPIAIPICLILWASSDSAMPTEAKVKEHYTAHKETLHRLVFLCQKDNKRRKTVSVTINIGAAPIPGEEVYRHLLDTLCIEGACSVSAYPETPASLESPVRIVICQKMEWLDVLQTELIYIPKHIAKRSLASYFDDKDDKPVMIAPDWYVQYNRIR